MAFFPLYPALVAAFRIPSACRRSPHRDRALARVHVCGALRPASADNERVFLARARTREPGGTDGRDADGLHPELALSLGLLQRRTVRRPRGGLPDLCAQVALGARRDPRRPCRPDAAEWHRAVRADSPVLLLRSTRGPRTGPRAQVCAALSDADRRVVGPACSADAGLLLRLHRRPGRESAGPVRGTGSVEPELRGPALVAVDRTRCRLARRAAGNWARTRDDRASGDRSRRARCSP